jgi:quercetin dioxygenase-like cupin family protein
MSDVNVINCELFVAAQTVDNVYIRMMEFQKAGDKCEGHAHKYNHVSLLASGSIKAKVRGDEATIETHVAPKLILIPKDVEHEFEALEPKTVLCCIHAVRDGNTIDDIAPGGLPAYVAKILLDKYPV